MMPTLEARTYELTAPGKLIVKSASLDLGALGEQQIAARTVRSAISPGTEIAAYRGDPPLRRGNPYPRVVGYCNVARVAAVGSSVTGLAVGTLVLTFQSHRSAFLCPAEEVVAVVPSDMSPSDAASTYLFQLGYNALVKGGIQSGFHVGVMGLGTLGLAAIAVGSHLGGRVHAFSGQEGLLRRAEALGARGHRKDAPGLADRILQATDGAGLDLLVTTSNSWQDWSTALRLLRKEGALCVLGFPGRTEGPPPFNPIDSEFFYDRQLRILSCGQTPDREAPGHPPRFTRRDNCRLLLDLVRSGTLPAKSLVSEVVGWSRLGDLYERLMRRDPGLVSAALNWETDGP